MPLLLYGTLVVDLFMLSSSCSGLAFVLLLLGALRASPLRLDYIWYAAFPPLLWLHAFPLCVYSLYVRTIFALFLIYMTTSMLWFYIRIVVYTYM